MDEVRILQDALGCVNMPSSEHHLGPLTGLYTVVSVVKVQSVAMKRSLVSGYTLSHQVRSRESFHDIRIQIRSWKP